MPRHTYELSEQTIKVLTGNIQEVAREMDVKPTQLYLYLSGTDTDPFSKFRYMFTCAARAGAPVEIWLAELESILARYTEEAAANIPPAKLTGEIVRELSEYIEAEIGHKSYEVQIKELVDIEVSIAKKKAAVMQAKNTAHFGNGTRNGAKAVVAEHRNGNGRK